MRTVSNLASRVADLFWRKADLPIRLSFLPSTQLNDTLDDLAEPKSFEFGFQDSFQGPTAAPGWSYLAGVPGQKATYVPLKWDGSR